MKILASAAITLCLTTTLVGYANATPSKTQFSCEQIKEKAVRQSCIDAREEQAKSAAADAEAKAERDKEDADEKLHQERMVKLDDSHCEFLGEHVKDLVAKFQSGDRTSIQFWIQKSKDESVSADIRKATKYAIMNWNVGTPREVKADSIVECKAHKFD